MPKENKFVIHTDGGSRGNPGPAAVGVVIDAEDGSLKKEFGEYIGHATNNEAEYRAVIVALKKLKALIGSGRAAASEILLMADSELLVRQLNGDYKVSDKKIQGWFMEIWNLRLDFAAFSAVHIFREKNTDADRMVNVTLDKELKGKLF